MEPVSAEISNAARAGRANRYAAVQALSEAGAGILAGTDSPAPFIVPGFSIHDELSALVEAGLTPAAALRAATSDAASFLGGEFGAVREGLRADLLLLGGNPLADIGATRDRVGVVLRGTWIEQGTLTARIDSLAATYAGSGSG